MTNYYIDKFYKRQNKLKKNQIIGNVETTKHPLQGHSQDYNHLENNLNRTKPKQKDNQ